MLDKIRERVNEYQEGGINRRQLLQSLVALTGSYAAAHLFLESSGLAASTISQRESQAANVDAETVHYPSAVGNYQNEGYLAKPKGSDKFSAVIVVHENRGVNEYIRDVTRRFAAEGFLALAPDLLSRFGGTAKMKSPEEAGAAIGRIPVYGAIDDLKDAFSYLAQSPDVDPQKISTVGFCWGGWRSFMLATEEPGLYRAVVFYGSSPDDGMETIHAPVLAHYAENDRQITGNSIWTDETMKRLGKKFQYYIYPNTFHAFFNDTAQRYDSEASKLAWARTLAFLRDQPLP